MNTESAKALREAVEAVRKASPGPWGCGDGSANEPATAVYCDDGLGSIVATCAHSHNILVNRAAERANAAAIAAAVNFLRDHGDTLLAALTPQAEAPGDAPSRAEDDERDAVTEAMVEAALITFRTSAKVTMPEIMRDTLLAALASRDAVGRDGWQPIETAPKDGETEILVWSACGEACIAIRPIGCPDDAVCDRSFIAFDATHWMPLPAPPAQEPAA